MRKAVLSIIVAVILITVSVFSINWIYKSGNFSSDSPTTVSELVECSNGFSFDMYRELAASGDENVFFSPYSITTALGMAYEGARGQTASEMADVLNFPTDNKTRWDMMQAYQEYMNANSDSYELSTANAYWLREGENLNDLYRNAIEAYYLAHGEELDFRGDPDGSREIINTWVEGQTNHKIKDLIPPGSINYDTYLVLTNAIYFLSDWKYQFDANATVNRTFHLLDGGQISTETMNMNDDEISLNYSENDDVQMLQLPYKGNDLSMYIILPRENDISAVESNLDYDYFNGLKGHMTDEWVNIFLPKFEFEQKYYLVDYLANMGMPTAFSNNADFSGIKADGSPLAISQVIHQSFVKVDKEGTEAAAATAVIMADYAVGPTEQPILFDANHPFIFFIQHEATGQILFMGKVGDPSQ